MRTTRQILQSMYYEGLAGSQCSTQKSRDEHCFTCIETYTKEIEAKQQGDVDDLKRAIHERIKSENNEHPDYHNSGIIDLEWVLSQLDGDF